MNVKALKEALHALPDDLLVLVAKDEEGNGFLELQDVGVYPYETSGWTFDILDEDDVDVEEDDPRGVVLWP